MDSSSKTLATMDIPGSRRGRRPVLGGCACWLAWLLPIACFFCYAEYRVWYRVFFPAAHPLSGEHAVCPPPGYSLPPPREVGLVDAESFMALLQAKAAFSDYEWYPGTTFAVKASVARQEVLRVAHHAAGDGSDGRSGGDRLQEPLDGRSSSELGRQDALLASKFRIASVTKLFTVLAVLLSKDKIGWDDPITKFVTDLEPASYGKVTIGALAGHTSGLGRFVCMNGGIVVARCRVVLEANHRQGYVGDLSFIPTFSPSMLGLQPVNHTLPGCDVFPGGRVCSPSEFLSMFNDPSYAPTSPHAPPLYSNIAFNLLGLALAAAHSKPFATVIHDLIFVPLNMTSSTFSTPSSGAIPPPQSSAYLAAPFANYDPSGGAWSTPDDMLRFLHALSVHELLTPAATGRWMRPHALLPSVHQLVGAPWEIFRPTDLAVRPRRPITVYAKAGGVGAYAAYSLLVPEFGIAATLHAAGEKADRAVEDLFPAVVRPLVAYADELARARAGRAYAGRYVAADGSNSSVLLEVDGGGGLRIGEFVVNGVAALVGLAALQGGARTSTARVYPIDENANGTGREAWRLVLDGKTSGSSDWFAERDCASWNWGDRARYAGEPLDVMVFGMDGGMATRIVLPGWRTTLVRELH